MKRPKTILFLLSASIIVVVACAGQALYLQLNLLPTDETLQGGLGSEPFNAVRFVTVGPTTVQNIGYFLYRDGTEVDMMPGVPLQRINGRMSLKETVDDYYGLAKSMENRRISPPLIREAIRGGSVAGYSVADMNMGVSVWDRTGAGDDSKVVLELMFEPAEAAKISRSIFAPCR